jgi:hypothetical protein
MLGEAVDVPDTAKTTPPVAPEEPAQIDYSNPSIEQFVSLWQSGQHEAVALRVLDALDRYADFLELAYRIGHDAAIELGQIMDSMTSEETSPHRYDTTPDTQVSTKMMGGRPVAGESHAAVGE